MPGRMRSFLLALAVYALGWILFGGLCGGLIGLAGDGPGKGAALGAGIFMVIGGIAEVFSREAPKSFLQRIAEAIEQGQTGR